VSKNQVLDLTMFESFFIYSVCLFVGTLWDIGVWYHVKGLQLYDDEDISKKKKGKKTLADVPEEGRVSYNTMALMAGNDLNLSAHEIRRKSYSS
jgi:hypothetical protein